MALPDLLWACPACGTDRGLQPVGSAFVCAACRTCFRRDRAARIRATRPDGERIVLEASEWVDRLPDVETLVEGGEGPIRTARVLARLMTKTDVVREGKTYLNRIEVLGDPEPAAVALSHDSLSLRRDGRPPTDWPLDRLAAVQASSSTLQVKVRGEPLLSLRFLDDSIFLWELLLQTVLRRFYERTGRGAIAEFQPRIVVREGNSEQGGAP